jgi:hypothetical protein
MFVTKQGSAVTALVYARRTLVFQATFADLWLFCGYYWLQFCGHFLKLNKGE